MSAATQLSLKQNRMHPAFQYDMKDHGNANLSPVRERENTCFPLFQRLSFSGLKFSVICYSIYFNFLFFFSVSFSTVITIVLKFSLSVVHFNSYPRKRLISAINHIQCRTQQRSNAEYSQSESPQRLKTFNVF